MSRNQQHDKGADSIDNHADSRQVERNGQRLVECDCGTTVHTEQQWTAHVRYRTGDTP